MAFDKKGKKKLPMPFDGIADGEGGKTPFDMQARDGKGKPGKPSGKPGKPGKSGKGGFMQALKNAKKKKGKR